ncbi:MAG TPA: hypothetical protein VFS99_04810 [Xanthomonadaceae bacterium]|nr:hypothetical protein [Xanthomonadaceae bacterium]
MVLRLLGAAWTLPNTVLGLVAGIAGMVRGASVHWRPRELAFVFQRYPWGPGGALTLGNTILHTGESLDGRCRTYAHRAGWCVEPEVTLADHERAHVFQYMVLGPLFLPVYFAFGGIGVRNRFERAADRYAATGRDWWPWNMAADERQDRFTDR